MRTPRTRYAHSGDASIAYQVAGDGPSDLVVISGPASHLEMLWEEPGTAHCFERLASFSRLILFDRRGTGLSDPVHSAPTLEQQMDDLNAVLEAVGSDQTAIFGASDLGLSALFAATYPDRVSALVLSGVAADGKRMITPDKRQLFLDAIEREWGEGTLIELFAPSQADNRAFAQWWTRMQKSAASPGMARQLLEMISQTDLRAVLPTIRVPTLVIHMNGDRVVPVELGREVAGMIPRARFIAYPGADAYAWSYSAGIDDIEEFLTGRRGSLPVDRVLSTVLFTDIVGSTARASAMGDGAWRELLDDHNRAVRAELQAWRGTEIKTIGDGFLATFDGPARAMRCAAAIVDSIGALGLPVRAGVHTGECELVGDDVAGIAVHIGARVMERADPGEVLASSTVRDLVIGSGLQFADRGRHALRGVPDEWHLYALDL